MSVNIKLLFDKIMNDPDIIPPSGQKKEDVAIAIAQQRVKQSENNIKALNMAKSKSSISDFINFIQLEKAPRKPKEFNIETFIKDVDILYNWDTEIPSGVTKKAEAFSKKYEPHKDLVESMIGEPEFFRKLLDRVSDITVEKGNSESARENRKDFAEQLRTYVETHLGEYEDDYSATLTKKYQDYTQSTPAAKETTEADAGSQTVESEQGPTSEETSTPYNIDKVFAIENKRKEINERGDREYVKIEGHPYEEEKLHPEELPLINEWMGLKGDNQLTVDDNLSHEHLTYLEAWLNSDAHGHDEGMAFFRDPVKRAEFDSVLDEKDYNSVYEAMVTPAKILSGEEKAKSGVSPREKGYTGNDVHTLDFLSTDPDSTSAERRNAKNRLARRNEKIAKGFENDKPVTEDAPTTSTNPRIRTFNAQHDLSGDDAITEEDGWDDVDFDVATHFIEQGEEGINNLQMFKDTRDLIGDEIKAQKQRNVSNSDIYYEALESVGDAYKISTTGSEDGPTEAELKEIEDAKITEETGAEETGAEEVNEEFTEEEVDSESEWQRMDEDEKQEFIENVKSSIRTSNPDTFKKFNHSTFLEALKDENILNELNKDSNFLTDLEFNKKAATSKELKALKEAGLEIGDTKLRIHRNIDGENDTSLINLARDAGMFGQKGLEDEEAENNAKELQAVADANPNDEAAQEAAETAKATAKKAAEQKQATAKQKLVSAIVHQGKDMEEEHSLEELLRYGNPDIDSGSPIEGHGGALTDAHREELIRLDGRVGTAVNEYDKEGIKDAEKFAADYGTATDTRESRVSDKELNKNVARLTALPSNAAQINMMNQLLELHADRLTDEQEASLKAKISAAERVGTQYKQHHQGEMIGAGVNVSDEKMKAKDAFFEEHPELEESMTAMARHAVDSYRDQRGRNQHSTKEQAEAHIQRVLANAIREGEGDIHKVGDKLRTDAETQHTGGSNIEGHADALTTLTGNMHDAISKRGSELEAAEAQQREENRDVSHRQKLERHLKEIGRINGETPEERENAINNNIALDKYSTLEKVESEMNRHSENLLRDADAYENQSLKAERDLRHTLTTKYGLDSETIDNALAETAFASDDTSGKVSFLQDMVNTQQETKEQSEAEATEIATAEEEKQRERAEVQSHANKLDLSRQIAEVTGSLKNVSESDHAEYHDRHINNKSEAQLEKELETETNKASNAANKRLVDTSNLATELRETHGLKAGDVRGKSLEELQDLKTETVAKEKANAKIENDKAKLKEKILAEHPSQSRRDLNTQDYDLDDLNTLYEMLNDEQSAQIAESDKIARNEAASSALKADKEARLKHATEYVNNNPEFGNLNKGQKDDLIRQHADMPAKRLAEMNQKQNEKLMTDTARQESVRTGVQKELYRMGRSDSKLNREHGLTYGKLKNLSIDELNDIKDTITQQRKDKADAAEDKAVRKDAMGRIKKLGYDQSQHEDLSTNELVAKTKSLEKNEEQRQTLFAQMKEDGMSNQEINAHKGTELPDLKIAAKRQNQLTPLLEKIKNAGGDPDEHKNKSIAELKNTVVPELEAQAKEQKAQETDAQNRTDALEAAQELGLNQTHMDHLNSLDTKSLMSAVNKHKNDNLNKTQAIEAAEKAGMDEGKLEELKGQSFAEVKTAVNDHKKEQVTQAKADTKDYIGATVNEQMSASSLTNMYMDIKEHMHNNEDHISESEKSKLNDKIGELVAAGAHDDVAEGVLANIGKPNYEEAKENLASQMSDIDTRQQEQRTKDTQQASYDDAVHGNGGMQSRMATMENSGADALSHVDEDGNVTHTEFMHPSGNVKVEHKEDEGNDHRDSHDMLTSGSGQRDLSTMRTNTAGWHPDHAKDPEQEQAIREFKQAHHDAQDSDPGSVEQKEALEKMKDLKEQYPHLEETANNIKSDAELEKERIAKGMPPGPPPQPGLVWAKNIKHWVKPENLAAAMQKMPEGQTGYLSPEAAKDIIHTEDGTADGAHEGGMLLSSNGLHAVSDNADMDSELDHDEIAARSLHGGVLSSGIDTNSNEMQFMDNSHFKGTGLHESTQHNIKDPSYSPPTSTSEKLEQLRQDMVSQGGLWGKIKQKAKESHEASERGDPGSLQNRINNIKTQMGYAVPGYARAFGFKSGQQRLDAQRKKAQEDLERHDLRRAQEAARQAAAEIEEK